MNKIVHHLGQDVHKDLRRTGSAEKNVRTHRPQAEKARELPRCTHLSIPHGEAFLMFHRERIEPG